MVIESALVANSALSPLPTVRELVNDSNARMLPALAASQIPKATTSGHDEVAGPKVSAEVKVNVCADSENVALSRVYPDPEHSTALVVPSSAVGAVVNSPTCQAVGLVADAVWNAHFRISASK